MLLSDVPVEDFYQIFSETISFHKQYGWVLLKEFDGTEVSGRRLDTKDVFLEQFTDEKFLINTPSLGYVNAKNATAYVSRVPKRIMKAGICSTNMKMSIPYIDRHNTPDVGLARYLRSFPKEFIDTFNNVYPSYEEALAQMGSGTYGVAFDRQFAICVNGYAYYRGDTRVGVWEAAGIQFDPEFDYLNMMIGDSCGKALQSLKQAPKTRVDRP